MRHNKSKIDLLNEDNGKIYYFESLRRDLYYSALVKDIVMDNRTGRILKYIFFSIVCLTFVFICVFGVLSIFNVSKKDNISFNDIGIALTGFGSILGSIIVLPQTIAKHLFPQNSEEVRFDFIKENQRNDQAYLDDSNFGELEFTEDSSSDELNELTEEEIDTE